MQFKKLKNGSILFIIKENHEQNTIHAISLSSPTLKHGNYRMANVQHGWNNIDEASQTFDSKQYQYIDNNDFKINVFDKRMEYIKNALVVMDSYKKTG